jgi:hypothetical protein
MTDLSSLSREELRSRELQLHELYMDTVIGSAEERRYEAQLVLVMTELDKRYRAFEDSWGADDTPILRDISRGYSGSEL